MKLPGMEKIQSCFEAALAVPEPGREDFLAKFCGDDSGLYREVKSLLEADAQSKAWDSQTVTKISDAIPRELQAGNTVGPYVIVELIGEGGMGVIYKAYDSRLDRHVALKFLPVSMSADPEIRQRFMTEARAASQLDHPNICVIHDVGENPDGQPYITMSCYDGETLYKRIRRGPLVTLDAIDIALQVGEGLASAHAHDIVHRDVKPANIMITSEGRAKVLDFGIAKVTDSNLTQTGMSIGTLAYMSPEQLRGETVDCRSDIWALGVVLYELLTGNKAFPGAALADILETVLHQSETVIEPLQSQLPSALYQVLRQAIAGDLQLRFKDMNAMLDALYDARASINNDDHNPQAVLSSQLQQTRVYSSKSHQWDEKILQQIADILVPDLGPIALTLVQRSSKKASDLDQLSELLVNFLPDQANRGKFIKKLERQTGEFTSPPVPGILNTDGSLQGVELSPLQLANIEATMLPFIGPIAQTIIKREQVKANNLPDLHNQLAQHLETDEKKQFLDELKGLLDTE